MRKTIRMELKKGESPTCDVDVYVGQGDILGQSVMAKHMVLDRTLERTQIKRFVIERLNIKPDEKSLCRVNFYLHPLQVRWHNREVEVVDGELSFEAGTFGADFLEHVDYVIDPETQEMTLGIKGELLPPGFADSN